MLIMIFVWQGAPGISNTAGAAVWALDYLLFAYVVILCPLLKYLTKFI